MPPLFMVHKYIPLLMMHIDKCIKNNGIYSPFSLSLSDRRLPVINEIIFKVMNYKEAMQSPEKEQLIEEICNEKRRFDKLVKC